MCVSHWHLLHYTLSPNDRGRWFESSQGAFLLTYNTKRKVLSMKHLIMLAAVAALIALPSCKKATEEEAVEDKQTAVEQAAGDVKEAAEAAAAVTAEATQAAAETTQAN